MMPILALFLFHLFFFPSPITADYIYHDCSSNKNFTDGSSTEQQLVQLLKTVIAKSSTSNFITASFNSSTAGEDSSLYMLLQCRRDLSSDDCASCSASAVSYLWKACHYKIDAMVWLGDCFLRYDNENFFSRLVRHHSFCTSDTSIKANVTAFKEKLGELMQGLVTRAVSNGGGFAKEVYSPFSKIYGLVQCNQDISTRDCSICLNDTLRFMLACWEKGKNGSALSPNCYVRYGDYMFYSNNLKGALVPAPAPPTPTMNNSVTGSEFNGEKSIEPNHKRILIGAATSVAGVIMSMAFVVFVVWRWKSRFNMPFFPLKKRRNTRNVEVFLKDHRSHMPKRYSYSDIMKITNSMKSKSGEGGFGSVYKGQLMDGRLVAVKILCESKGNGEDFINEVATISRTAHVNIVGLVGFCSEGSKRALIYDFMSNGSLEKFIFTETPKYHSLTWETLFEIALGIARGLEYLHRGCNMHILHLDIKPHNILLDQDFCPKISDFGLAKLYPDKQSFIWMTQARGTAGYMAPEVYSRNFGGVSHKSDVYSYGMLILEIAGGRRNFDARLEKSSEIYYPGWVYDRIDQRGDLQLGELTSERDDEMARKMIVVGLWCIQIMPGDRPSMSKVVEMLEGSLEGLQLPPKPFACSFESYCRE